MRRQLPLFSRPILAHPDSWRNEQSGPESLPRVLVSHAKAYGHMSTHLAGERRVLEEVSMS